MFEKCLNCKHCNCIAATWDDPGEEWCEKDRDEFFEENEVNCPEFEETWNRYDYAAANYSRGNWVEDMYNP